MEQNKSIRAGVIQFDVVNGQIDTNMKTVFRHLDTLKDQGAELAVLPELFSCGFDNENLGRHSQETDRVVTALTAYSRKNNIAVAGSLPVKHNDKIFNRMVFIDKNGALTGYYEKIHLFRPTLEHLFFEAADKLSVLDTSFGKIGLAICYDLRFPELFTRLTKMEAKIILVSAQWPETRKTHWKILAQARAIENQCFMILSNRTGRDGDLSFPGWSMIIDPLGNIIADAGAKKFTAFGDIDVQFLEEIRKTLPFLPDRRPSVYGY